MGDSSKRDDPTKIGQFSSGLKYSIALLLRHDVEININIEGYEQHETYSFTTTEMSDGNKSKEVIEIKQTIIAGNAPIQTKRIRTGFALQLGYNWELWMALRELWSNMLDEGGFIKEDFPNERSFSQGTVIALTFDDDSEFADIWRNRNLYINSTEPLFKLNKFDILDNPDKYLKIYKQNILVHSDKDIPSRWAYNIHFGGLDERRMLLRLPDVKQEICLGLAKTNIPGLIDLLISDTDDFEHDDYIWNFDSIWIGDLHKDIVNVAYKKVDFYTLPWINKLIRKRKDCQLPGKTIRTLEDSIWTASNNITVNSIPTIEPPVFVEDVAVSGFQVKINQFYKFDIGDVEVRVADMAGGKCYADKYNKCIVVSPSFNIETDFYEFILQYYEYTREQRESLVHVLSKEYCKLISN
jgi:hypothetical protein